MMGLAGATSPPQPTPPLECPLLSPARGERRTEGERGHAIAAKCQDLAEQGTSPLCAGLRVRKRSRCAQIHDDHDGRTRADMSH